jgi:hypothetical protein
MIFHKQNIKLLSPKQLVKKIAGGIIENIIRKKPNTTLDKVL